VELGRTNSTDITSHWETKILPDLLINVVPRFSVNYVCTVDVTISCHTGPMGMSAGLTVISLDIHIFLLFLQRILEIKTG
jgi:uncharacterized integral membrane protein